MLFTIQDIEIEENITFVSGSTSIGNIKGVWKDESVPVIGNRCHIEIDFGTVDRKAIMIHQEPTEANARIVDNKVIFTGLCEDIDEVYFLRFSFDGLEMLDIQNDDLTIQKGDFLSFPQPFSEISIYPY